VLRVLAYVAQGILTNALEYVSDKGFTKNILLENSEKNNTVPELVGLEIAVVNVKGVLTSLER
jgi:hypothetical protein